MRRSDKDAIGHSDRKIVGYEYHMAKSSNQQRAESKTYPFTNLAHHYVRRRGVDLEQGTDKKNRGVSNAMLQKKVLQITYTEHFSNAGVLDRMGQKRVLLGRVKSKKQELSYRHVSARCGCC